MTDLEESGPRRAAEEREAMDRRLYLLERENARLKGRLSDVGLEDNPNFNPGAFQKALQYYTRYLVLPVILVAPLMVAAQTSWLPFKDVSIGPLPLVDSGNSASHRGIGIGIIAAGALSIGVVAVGGLSVGILAMGGGAIGGGAAGIFALGGGAIGVYALGGGAAGKYVLGGSGVGKYVFSLKRQDAEAVAFWTRWLPRLRVAVTNPMPVIPVETRADGFQDETVSRRDS